MKSIFNTVFMYIKSHQVMAIRRRLDHMDWYSYANVHHV